MKECAFCMKLAKLSGEHIHSDWINKILQGPWIRTFNSSEGGRAEHPSPGLDWKAKVVCEECNNGWMSEIENRHASPVIGPLVRGEKIGIPISQSDAQSIAIFAFKTALVVDALRKSEDRFYSQRIRTAFMRGLNIPSNVNMWLCAYLTREQRADALSGYYKGDKFLEGVVQLHVCTLSAGSFAFQVLGVKALNFGQILPERNFDYLSVPFWPFIPNGFVWPPRRQNRIVGLDSVEQFVGYHRRWESIVSFPLG